MRKLIVIVIASSILVTGCLQTREDKEYQGYINNAELAYEKSDFASVVELYEKAEDIKPLSEDDKTTYEKSKEIVESQAYYEKGIASYAEGSYKVAMDNFKKVIEADPYYEEAQKSLTEARNKHAEKLLAEAKSLYEAGDYKEAYEVLMSSLATTTPQYEPAKALYPQFKEKRNIVIRAEEKEIKKRELELARKQMKSYEKGIGPVSIAADVKTTKRVDDRYQYWTAAKGCQYVWVCVFARNEGSKTTHVNPNYITLSTPDGHTVNPDTGPTYSRQNKFDAINLPPKGKSSGWLIFHAPIEDKYSLNFNSIDSKVTKQIVP
ncbi:MAG: DUF4352 domain-containing protein [Firmicutes bacterium]|nr:DUF4352 domain-containing protein [Bacillota bacterium]